MTGTIFNIQRYAIHDGPGIRTTIFFQGCPLRCWWCHNPESQQFELLSPSEADGERVKSGHCVTSEELIQEIEKDVVFFDESGGGVTFSGGEPLMQSEFLVDLLEQCAAQEIHTVVDTCGYASADVFHAVLTHTNLILYDLKILDDDAHRRYTGGSNRLVLDNLGLLSKSDTPYSIRFPVIPGITDTQANIEAVLKLLNGLRGLQQISLLPYHRTAIHKYHMLQRDYQMDDIAPPSEAALQDLKHLFDTHGFQTIIGG
jgi:pyruvate formate lyase activating enzyme